LVSPTADRDPVKRAIGALKLSESTATGEAIFAELRKVLLGYEPQHSWRN
jgi:Ca-activated chloride channel homolog